MENKLYLTNCNVHFFMLCVFFKYKISYIHPLNCTLLCALQHILANYMQYL